MRPFVLNRCLLGASAATLAASLALFASGCGSGGSAEAPHDAGAPHEAGIKIVPIKVGGDTTIGVQQADAGARSYILHVPPTYDGKTAMPLVVNFHGLSSNAAQQELFSGMNTKADAAGFFVLYPQGLNSSFNAGTCCPPSVTAMVDDVGFTRLAIADVSQRVHVDAKRVYATGMSNGGFMSHRLACEAADLFAAVAPVSGVLGIPPDQCKPSHPMPVIEFHGTADTLVPYDGGGFLNFVSVPDTFAGWGTRNGCTDTPAETYDSGAAHCGTYSACSSGVKVTLCTIDGEGHCWPGTAFCPYGMYSTDINADDAMWSFFQAYTLP